MKKPIKIVLFSINILIVILLTAFSALLIVLSTSKTDYALKLIQTNGDGYNYSADTLVLTKKVDVADISEGDIVIIRNDNTENVITIMKISGDMLHFNNRFGIEEVVKINEYNLEGKIVFENQTLGAICSLIVNNDLGSLVYILIFGFLAICILTLVIIDMAYIRRKNTARSSADSVSDANITVTDEKYSLSYISSSDMDDVHSDLDVVSSTKASDPDKIPSDTIKKINDNTDSNISLKLSRYAIHDDVDLQLSIHSQSNDISDDADVDKESPDDKSDLNHTKSPLTK